jgi:hypothetical protein
VATAFAGRVVLDYGTPERLTPAEIVGAGSRCSRRSTPRSTS